MAGGCRGRVYQRAFGPIQKAPSVFYGSQLSSILSQSERGLSCWSPNTQRASPSSHATSLVSAGEIPLHSWRQRSSISSLPRFPGSSGPTGFLHPLLVHSQQSFLFLSPQLWLGLWYRLTFPLGYRFCTATRLRASKCSKAQGKLHSSAKTQANKHTSQRHLPEKSPPLQVTRPLPGKKIHLPWVLVTAVLPQCRTHIWNRKYVHIC